jgi:hypothetical protein
MKKVALFFLALVVLAGFAMKDSEAGQLCWKLNPYTDIIKVSTSTPDSLYDHTLLNGRWRARNPGGYACPVVGSMEKHFDGVNKVVGLHATATVGGTLYSAIIEATINPKTNNGTWNLLRSDGGTISGTFTRVDCVTGIPLGTSTASSSESHGNAMNF